MPQPINLEMAKMVSKDLVDIIQQETENYGKYGMMGPDLFAEIAGYCDDLDPEVLKMAGEYLTDNGIPPDAAGHVISHLPHVASILITCIIQGQKPKRAASNN